MVMKRPGPASPYEEKAASAKKASLDQNVRNRARAVISIVFHRSMATTAAVGLALDAIGSVHCILDLGRSCRRSSSKSAVETQQGTGSSLLLLLHLACICLLLSIGGSLLLLRVVGSSLLLLRIVGSSLLLLGVVGCISLLLGIGGSLLLLLIGCPSLVSGSVVARLGESRTDSQEK